MLGAVLTLASCGRIARNGPDTMGSQEILRRSTHVFIGVIERHEHPSKLLIRVTGEDAGKWMVVRMRVRIENVLRGFESRPVVDIYEVFWAGGLMGDWNSTQDNYRYLFPVRWENGRYHLTRDFWRSIYPVYSGSHRRLPLTDASPLWERFALLQWWVQPDRSGAFGETIYTDPGGALGRWRKAKILRGLLHHPDKDVRLAACEDLLHMTFAQDECWDSLEPGDRQKLNQFWNMVPPDEAWNQSRRFLAYTRDRWDQTVAETYRSPDAINDLRLFTTVNDARLRREFCEKFMRRYPADHENGCPADGPPPATIVTEDGDIPLIGAWPKP